MLLTRIKTLEAQAEEAKQFYGKVDGGEKGHVLLFQKVPTSAKENTKDFAACIATRDSWLKLSYPVKRTSWGSSPASWFKVHVVDASTGEFSYYVVSDKTEDGSKAFSHFSVYVEGDD